MRGPLGLLDLDKAGARAGFAIQNALNQVVADRAAKQIPTLLERFNFKKKE